MAKSHPTYNREYIKWGQKPNLTPEERVKQVKAVDPYSKEGQELQEYHAKKNGRGWHIFQGVNLRHNRKQKTWIEQFYVARHEEEL
jgi:hypothetical protein